MPSCYRCLRTYRNQRVHGLLNWRLVLPQLLATRGETVETLAAAIPAHRGVLEGPDWDEARREGCGSPQELRLLRAMRDAGLPEPQKQFRITSDAGRLITQADFAYPDRHLLIYVDGLAFHSSIRMRVHDSMQTNQLQNMGYRVLRFVGPQVARRITDCTAQIQAALA
jgi:very-short-patch-repair endonuclease